MKRNPSLNHLQASETTFRATLTCSLFLIAGVLQTSGAWAVPDTPANVLPPTLREVACIDEDGMVEPMNQWEEVRMRPVGLALQFSAPMWNPPGDATPGDVTSIHSYRLLAAGPDQGLDTDSCDAPDIDEELIPILDVKYDETVGVAQLVIDFGDVPDYEEGQYRLLVCSPEVEGRDGAALDGNGDGVGGDDAQFSFRLERRNHFVNGYFDQGLHGWTPNVGISEDWTYVSDADVDLALTSGAAELSNLTGLPQVGVDQCAEVSDWERLRFQSRVSAPPGSDEPVIVHACAFFAIKSCSGVAIGQIEASTVAQGAHEGWATIETEVVPMPGTVSMRCAFSASLDSEIPTILVDEISLSQLPTFRDDFETGHVGRWTSRYPTPE